MKDQLLSECAVGPEMMFELFIFTVSVIVIVCVRSPASGIDQVLKVSTGEKEDRPARVCVLSRASDLLMMFELFICYFYCYC